MADEKIPIRGEEAVGNDLQWIDYGRKLLEESPQVLDEEAKSLVTLGSSLLMVYTSVLALFKFTDRLELSGANLYVMLFSIILWLLCISFSEYVHFPGKYKVKKNSPDSIVKRMEEIIRIKHNRLKVGAIIFILALTCSSFSIIWLSHQISDPDILDHPQEAQLIISEDKISTLAKIGILKEEGSGKSIPLILLESTDKTYKIRLPDGRKAELNKDLVIGIVYS